MNFRGEITVKCEHKSTISFRYFYTCIFYNIKFKTIAFCYAGEQLFFPKWLYEIIFSLC